jgi:hypothetical protein
LGPRCKGEKEKEVFTIFRLICADTALVDAIRKTKTSVQISSDRNNKEVAGVRRPKGRDEE